MEGQKWEYRVWYLDTSVEAESIQGDLERLGREGWELVSVSPFDSPSYPDQQTLVAFFKRPG
jgi:hypothetical protein